MKEERKEERKGCIWCIHGTMADLHDDVTYEGWGKTSTLCHRECMGIL